MLALVLPAATLARTTGARTAADYVAAALADNTRRAYASDLHEFIAWAGSLPLSPQVVVEYLAAHADTHSRVSLERVHRAAATMTITKNKAHPVPPDLPHG